MPVDAHPPRGELDLLPRAHPVVGAAPVDLDRADGRGHLVDLADEAGQRRADRVVVELVGRRAGEHLTLGVVGGGGDAEPDGGVVRLVGELQVAEQPGGPADADEQHAGGHRVERAGVADLAGAGEPPHPRDHVVGGQSRRACRRRRPADPALTVGGVGSARLVFVVGVDAAASCTGRPRRRTRPRPAPARPPRRTGAPARAGRRCGARSRAARRGRSRGSARAACRAACRPRSGSAPWPSSARPPTPGGPPGRPPGWPRTV